MLVALGPEELLEIVLLNTAPESNVEILSASQRAQIRWATGRLIFYHYWC